MNPIDKKSITCPDCDGKEYDWTYGSDTKFEPCQKCDSKGKLDIIKSETTENDVKDAIKLIHLENFIIKKIIKEKL